MIAVVRALTAKELQVIALMYTLEGRIVPPMLPSLSRSSKGSPRLRYSAATLATKLRFDCSSSFTASLLPLRRSRASGFSSSFVNRGNPRISEKYFESSEFFSCRFEVARFCNVAPNSTGSSVAGGD